MENFDRKKHWETIYQTKQLSEVSWYQPTPETSLKIIKELNLPKTAKIIDIGGGDSLLVDHLLDLGFQDITVLDISETGIEKAKQRLRNKGKNVKWIITDSTKFQPTEQYDLWHDRAAFHFLTNKDEISNYIKIAYQSMTSEGNLVLGTFSEQGPTTCSGIEIKQYSEKSVSEQLAKYFKKIHCFTTNHETPFNTIQNFLFCIFKKEHA